MYAYPLVILLHISNPTLPASREVTHDYLGAGIGVEFRNGLTVEGSIGMQSLGCVTKSCGRSTGATLSVTWRGKRRG
jgi:hypothetical protein